MNDRFRHAAHRIADRRDSARGGLQKNLSQTFLETRSYEQIAGGIDGSEGVRVRLVEKAVYMKPLNESVISFTDEHYLSIGQRQFRKRLTQMIAAFAWF